MSKNLKIGEEMETNIRQDNNEEVEIDIMQILMMLLSMTMQNLNTKQSVNLRLNKLLKKK